MYAYGLLAIKVLVVFVEDQVLIVLKCFHHIKELMSYDTVSFFTLTFIISLSLYTIRSSNVPIRK